MKSLTSEQIQELSQTRNGFYSWDYVARLASRVVELEAERKWIPVSEAELKSFKVFIVACKAKTGKIYTGLAQYFAEKDVPEEEFIGSEFWGEESITDYDEESDCYYVKEGWFEYSMEGEIAYRLSDPIILVMPLPKPPESDGE